MESSLLDLPGLTPLSTHNMELHVRRMACLYKTMDSPLDQWAPGVVISSRSPWKPVVSDQPGEAWGGVWIEVARRARRFADGPEPERAGEGTTRLLCQPVWGTSPLRNTGRFNWMFYSAFSFAFTRHSGLSDWRIFFDHTGKFFSARPRS